MKENNLRNIVGVTLPEALDYLPTGCRPVNATQINKSFAMENGVYTLHTVTANKVFHLTDFRVIWSSTISNVGYMYVYNDSAVLQYSLYDRYCYTNQWGEIAMNFASAVEIPAGWYINIYSAAVGLKMIIYIHGWEIDA